jgi:hypothetical protein
VRDVPRRRYQGGIGVEWEIRLRGPEESSPSRDVVVMTEVIIAVAWRFARKVGGISRVVVVVYMVVMEMECGAVVVIWEKRNKWWLGGRRAAVFNEGGRPGAPQGGGGNSETPYRRLFVRKGTLNALAHKPGQGAQAASLSSV